LFNLNTRLKILLIAIAVPVIVLFVLFFSFGGYGNKDANTAFIYPPDSTILFAHRGIAAYFPENSLESIGDARRLGFTAVEFDLRKSADGDFVLFHDVDAKRMLGSGIEIKDISTSDLKNYPYFQKGKQTQYFVPTLKKVLDNCSSDFIFYLDMKLTSFQEADQIVQIIHSYGIENSSIVASADLLFTLYIEYRYPGINTALEGFDAGKEWTYNLFPKNLKPDFLSGFLSKVDDQHIEWLKDNGLLHQRIVYGVDSLNFRLAQSLGLKNIILDFDTISQAFKIPNLLD